MTVSRCKHISYCGWAHPQICCDTSGSSQLLVVQCGTGTVCSPCSTSQCHVVSSTAGSSSSNDDGGLSTTLMGKCKLQNLVGFLLPNFELPLQVSFFTQVCQ